MSTIVKVSSVTLGQPDSKVNSVRFRGGDREKDVVSNVYINRSHPDIAGAREIRVTVEVVR